MILQLRRLGMYQAPGTTVQPSWRYLPHCLAAALLLRLGLHMFSDFVAYPDELYNYLEQGHRLAFGYGLIFWEWNWGARSHLLPGVVAGLLLPFKWLGIDHPAYYVPFVEAFFCIFSLMIPWGLYHFTRHQHGEAAGRIALLLGVVSFYLLAFAAKALTEVMAGTLLAAALGLTGRPFIRGDAGAWLFGILLGAAACMRYLHLPGAGILWLVVAIAMGILLPHMLTYHKEFRYVTPLLFLWMPAAGWLLSDWGRRARLRRYRHDLVRGLIGIQLAFGMLVALGYVKDNWIYQVGDLVKFFDQLGYLHNTPDFFAGLVWLHEQEDLEGVYFNVNNVNYYYLHRDVPIYDGLTFQNAQLKHPDKKLYSHIVTYSVFINPDYALVKQIGRIRIYKDLRDLPVYSEDYTSAYYDEPLWRHSAEVLPPPIKR